MTRRTAAPSARAATALEANARLHGLEPRGAAARLLRTRRVPPLPWRIAQRLALRRGALSYETSWLGPLAIARREQLGDAAGPPRFLVRVDEFPDSTSFDTPAHGIEASRRLHATMAEAGVPHMMAVVPGYTHAPLDPTATGGRELGEEEAALLARMAREGVTFAQHGATHRTRLARPRRRSELEGRDDADLLALLDAGRERLARVGVRPRILVPPFNTFAARQWPALASRYDIVTGGPESIVRMGLHGGPLWRGRAVYLPCYPPLYGSAASVVGAVERILGDGVSGWVPIVLHTTWELEDGFAGLRRLAERVAPYAASWEELLAAVDASRPAR